MKKQLYTLAAALIISAAGMAQSPTVLADFDFNEGTSYPLAASSTASNITASVNGSQTNAAYSGTVTGTNAFVANTTAGNSLSMTNTNVNTWTLTLGGSGLYQYTSYKVYFQSQRSSDGATTVTLAYSTDGSTYTNASTTASPGNGSFTEATIDLSTVAALNNQSAVYIKFSGSGATNSSGTLRIDNLEIQGTESASETNGINTTFNGAVTAPTLSVTGSVTTSSLAVGSLGGSGTGFVYVDSLGNISAARLPNNTSVDIPCNYTIPWSLGGNTIGNYIANPKIGTCDSHDFIMETNGTERMRVSYLGNVGIGTGSPSAQLDILASGTNAGLNISNSSNSIFNVANNGNVTASTLAGSTTNMVVASSTGVLSTQTLPTDDQTLSLSGNNLSISNGNSVTLPTPAGDNMGNCVATTDVNMQGNGIWFVSDIVFTNAVVGGATAIGPIPGNIGLEVFGDFEVGDDLTTAGDANIEGTTGVTIPSGGLNIGSGNATIDNSGAASFGGTLGVTGVSTLGTVNADAVKGSSLKSTGTLDVSSTSTFGDDVTISGDTYDPGSGDFDYALTVNGSGNISDMWYGSDRRYKRSINKLESVTDKIKKLNSYTYYYKTEEFKEKGFSTTEQIGFIAQELKEVFPQLVREDKKGYLAVNYNGMIPILLEAIKEQKKTIDSLHGNSTKQDSINTALQNQLNQLASVINSCCSINATGKIGASIQNIELSDKDVIVLNQNVPNPFAEQTAITYNIPQNAGVAQLLFYDALGRQIKTVDIATKGAGQLNVYANDLTNGIYSYTLIVDGNIVATKKMIKTQ